MKYSLSEFDFKNEFRVHNHHKFKESITTDKEENSSGVSEKLVNNDENS